MSAVNANVDTAEEQASALRAGEGASSVSAPSGAERRTRLQETIDSLVRLRLDVISAYCRLAGVGSLERHGGERFRLAPDELVRFCEVMVDYTAMGHFEVYQRIIEGKERRGAVREAAADVYPAIAETTDYLVDFNDKYDDFGGTDEEVEALGADIGRLGEIIAIRVKLEDQILAALSR